MFVHDLNQFVSVQLLEETLAVLSLGKLCKDHGYFNEWVSGSRATIDQKWEKYFLQDRQPILYLLSFQGYPPTLEAVRLLQRHHKYRWDERHSWSLATGLHQAHLQIQYEGEVTN